ncbi:MAG TPA: hypothetical protein VEY09_18160 [Pyrinomonadaceae bacterium]|nr:hypothetical protein [Pyrinomonadaceae bacterium]
MSTNPDSGGQMTPDVAMTLASITYCADIRGALKTYLPDWSAVWSPDAAVRGNYAFIARNEVTGRYAVAIRGSLLNFSWGAFYNWFEQDFNIFEQVDWQYPVGPQSGQKISQGSSDGLDDLTELQQTDEAGATTMLDYLLKYAPGAKQSVAVVGHSLGGNLATVFAPWLLYAFRQHSIPPPSLNVYTFAAPPAGNTQFVGAYDAAFPDSRRYFNTLDIVPMASVPASIMGMGVLYYPEPQASEISVTYDGMTVTLAEAFDAIALLVGASEIENDNSSYSQTNVEGGSVPLNPDDSYCQTDPSDPLVVQWFEKAGCEHGHDTYLRLLGAPPVDCEQVPFTP